MAERQTNGAAFTYYVGARAQLLADDLCWPPPSTEETLRTALLTPFWASTNDVHSPYP